MQAVVNGLILMPDGVVAGQALLFEETIRGLCPQDALPEGCSVIDAWGQYVAPGFVDVHIHGYLGADASDADADGLRRMARGVAANGVTSFLPTTMTVSADALQAAFDTIRALRGESRKPGFCGAEILGAHAEGPFINAKRKGAQNGAHVLLPDAALMLKHADVIRLLTVAPEVGGCFDLIREITQRTETRVSIGHTDATFEQAAEAVRCGASHATHTFNAMSPLNHRAPGAAGAALSLPVTAELIADTFHIHPGLFPLLYRAKGDRLVLVTDCTRAGGMPEGEYDLGGQAFRVSGGRCLLPDGTLAGSVLKMNEAVRNLARYAGIPLWEAVQCASRNPAAAIGEKRKGALEPGRDADVILMDENCTVSRTIVCGKTVFALTE